MYIFNIGGLNEPFKEEEKKCLLRYMSLEPKKAPYFFRNFLIISIDLFKALEYFTEKKLVHRDIKRKQCLPYSGFVCEVLICTNSER